MLRAGLLAILFSLGPCVLAQSMPMGLTGTFMLVAQNDVKKEIKLTKEQDKLIQQIAADMQKDPSQLGMPDMHYMTRPMDAKVVDILDAGQNTRLKELFWQFNGLFALSEPDLCEALSMSEDSRSKASELIKSYDKAVMDDLMARKGRPDKKAMATLREKATADLTALLTPEQLETWKSLQGKPFKFPKAMAR